MEHELTTCSHCGIRYEKNKISCPVCEVVIKEEMNSKTVGSRRFISALVLLCMVVTVILIVLVIDFLFDATFTWSLPVVVSVGTSLLYLFLFLYTVHAPFQLSTGIAIITTGMLYLLNYLQQADWFLYVGLPLAIGIPFVLGITFFLIKRYSSRLLIVAWFLLGGTVMTLYIDIVLSFQQSNIIAFNWSWIVMASTTPIIGMLFYVNKYKMSLQKWFHF